MKELLGWVRFEVKYAHAQFKEHTFRLGLRLAHRLPRGIRYVVTLDSLGRATSGRYGTTDPGALPAMEVLDRI